MPALFSTEEPSKPDSGEYGGHIDGLGTPSLQPGALRNLPEVCSKGNVKKLPLSALCKLRR